MSKKTLKKNDEQRSIINYSIVTDVVAIISTVIRLVCIDPLFREGAHCHDTATTCSSYGWYVVGYGPIVLILFVIPIALCANTLRKRLDLPKKEKLRTDTKIYLVVMYLLVAVEMVLPIVYVYFL
ncbi:hypothetical protein IJI28_00210 [Candidatus Saccharibacteria bacterium]|nr:hypothetical protein [Candidatus Saccharibacteria bacterium]